MKRGGSLPPVLITFYHSAKIDVDLEVPFGIIIAQQDIYPASGALVKSDQENGQPGHRELRASIVRDSTETAQRQHSPICRCSRCMGRLLFPPHPVSSSGSWQGLPSPSRDCGYRYSFSKSAGAFWLTGRKEEGDGSHLVVPSLPGAVLLVSRRDGVLGLSRAP